VKCEEWSPNSQLSTPNSKLQTSGLQPDLQKTVAFLLAAQHPTGGWGGIADRSTGRDSERDYVTVTARCVAALKHYSDAQEAIELACQFLRPFVKNPETIPPEPIGLYFAHLWYSEELYGAVFLGSAEL